MEMRVFLLLVIAGVITSTGIIVIVFIIINKCIRRKVVKYSASSTNHAQSYNEKSSTFKHNYPEDIRPPLPPRDQFDTKSINDSYEEMPEIPVAEEETSFSPNPVSSVPPETRVNSQDNCSASESYDDVEVVQNAWHSIEDTLSLPDYLEVDPPVVQDSDNGSENYDDVEQLHTDNEDYDDVD